MDDSTTSQKGMVNHIFAWFAHPFNTEGTALNWILFFGLFFIAAWSWNYVLIQIAGKEI